MSNNYKAIVVVVRIFDAATDKMESETIKTIDGRERRNWVIATVMWAMFNKKYVEIINKEDDDRS